MNFYVEYFIVVDEMGIHIDLIAFVAQINELLWIVYLNHKNVNELISVDT